MAGKKSKKSMSRKVKITDSLWINSSVTQSLIIFPSLVGEREGASAWVSVGVGGGGVGCYVNPFTAMMLLENEQ